MKLITFDLVKGNPITIDVNKTVAFTSGLSTLKLHTTHANFSITFSNEEVCTEAYYFVLDFLEEFKNNASKKFYEEEYIVDENASPDN